MQYIKQLLEFHTQQLQQTEESPEQSGEFQIIDLGQIVEDREIDSQFGKFQVAGGESVGKSAGSEKLNQDRPSKKIGQHDTTPDQMQTLNQILSKQYSIIQIDEDQPKSQRSNFSLSASTIKIDEYYMIVSTQQLNNKFKSQQQWSNFYNKIKSYHHDVVKATNNSLSVSFVKSQYDRKRVNISLNLKQLNSILEIRPWEIQRRQEYWNRIAVPSLNVRFKQTQLSSKKDPLRLQKNVSKIMDGVAPSLLFQIVEKKYKQIQNVQDELSRWKACIIKVLTLYGAYDKQIGYSKGLEYVALGILVAKPFGQVKLESYQPQMGGLCLVKEPSEVFSPTFTQNQTSQEYKQLQTHFKYLLFTKQLRNMYFPGTPKLYQQIQLLTQQMICQVPMIHQKLELMKVDFIKLFINYYKTFLMYRLKNPQVIRKVMQLLIVYGINFVRVLLTRIMNINQNKIVAMMGQEIEVLRYLAESLVQDYFGNGDTEQIISKFKRLFILDITK